jgi:hypothetical protein
MKLVKFSRDWADEFVAEGFDAIPDYEWEEFVEAVKENPDALTSYWFGTNEGWENETIKSFYDYYEVKELPYADGMTLYRFLIPNGSFGVFPHPLELIKNFDE